ncbi:cation transporter [Candidatus Bipolaricaulota bacterium]|nr:cation transporter [Candidatus Bipolaricaulota bacterium]
MIGHIPKSEATAAMISLGVGVTLLIVKFAAYFITESTAIYSDAVESIANVLGSAVAFYALVVAHRPADKDHPWGHGKIEFLSAGFEGGLILLAALFIVIRTLDALRTGELLREQALDYGLLLLVLAMVVNGVVGLLLLRTGKRRGSMTLEADGKHLLSDVVTSAGVLLALVIVRLTGWKYLDPITALLMAGYIGWMGTRLVRKAASGLMDEQDIEHEKRIRAILDAHVGPNGLPPQVCSYHNLRHRSNGRFLWVDFHVNVPGQTPIKDAHAIASAIEHQIEQAFNEADATAHVEDCVDKTCSHAPPISHP